MPVVSHALLCVHVRSWMECKDCQGGWLPACACHTITAVSCVCTLANGCFYVRWTPGFVRDAEVLHKILNVSGLSVYIDPGGRGRPPAVDVAPGSPAAAPPPPVPVPSAFAGVAASAGSGPYVIA